MFGERAGAYFRTLLIAGAFLRLTKALRGTKIRALVPEPQQAATLAAHGPENRPVPGAIREGVVSGGTNTSQDDHLRDGKNVASTAVFTPPPGAHHELTRIRGWTYNRLRPVSNDVGANLKSTPCLRPETDRVLRRARGFCQSRRVMYMAPRLRGFRDPRPWPPENRELLATALGVGPDAILVNAHAHFGYSPQIGGILRVHELKRFVDVYDAELRPIRGRPLTRKAGKVS